jgi:hypothetical protein
MGKCGDDIMQPNALVRRLLWPTVEARMPALGLIYIHMVIVGIRLQTWMRVIVDVDE